jgi:alpha-amylase/alpha-mannosidase (GH57 family)
VVNWLHTAPEVFVSTPQPRYVCIHGHFYQPPRENPWLEAVEVQDSAAPYHDWNERITRECYAPNCRARLLDRHPKIHDILNNYAWISFNFGPTLLAWMEEEAPEVLQGILEGDRLSRERRGGHGNALAQVYNHVIMPLASERDKRTQVRWGVADFRRRFGHDPEGMWLAETAADLATLEALADAGIRFTILAPRQARRWRKIGDDDKGWTAIPEGIDPSRAYLCRLPSGNSIALFFYDGVISRQVAFERLLDSGARFVERLKLGFDDARTHAQLVHIATDGESYGHHHPHGDMALAFALKELAQDPEVRLTNYGEYLELHPPEWEVEIHDNSSWSCVHGVERWRSDCGCRMRADWQQRWRGPLRQGLDALKVRLDRIYAREGSRLFRDPWAARDDYVEVILSRGRAATSPLQAVDDFLDRHARPDAARPPVPDAVWLLEMQRNALLMFTSCGWFFDEVSGLEATQCLRYAARAIQLARRFRDGGPDLEAEFVRHLEKAPSNLPSVGDGRGVWEQFILPSRIDLERVLAHHAIRLLFHKPQERTRIYCYELETLDQEVRARGGLRLGVGRVRARSTLTLHEAETAFVVLHYGGLDFHTVLRKTADPAGAAEQDQYASFKRRLLETYEEGSIADVTTLVSREFEGEVHRIEDLFDDEKRHVIGIVLQDRLEEYQATFARLAAQDADVLLRLGRMKNPIPASMRAAASVVLDQQLLQDLRELQSPQALQAVRTVAERAAAWGYRPERERLQKELSEELRDVLRRFDPEADLPLLTGWAANLLDAAALLGVKLDLWQTQNQLLETYARLTDAGPLGGPLHETFAGLADRLNISRTLLGWRP